jgi:uncharacterized protein with von Willebrand factor type A (vWA) domain
MTSFGVETVELPLAELTAAFSRRLHDAGVPVTPERPVAFARALRLVRPISRRRLYWTARGVFVSDRAHVRPFDAVFGAVFGTGPEPVIEHPVDAARENAPRERPIFTGMPKRAGTTDEVEVPRAVAGEEERVASPRVDPLAPAHHAPH